MPLLKGHHGPPPQIHPSQNRSQTPRPPKTLPPLQQNRRRPFRFPGQAHLSQRGRLRRRRFRRIALKQFDSGAGLVPSEDFPTSLLFLPDSSATSDPSA